MKYSKSAHKGHALGFFFDDDPSVPRDAINVSDADVQTVINLPKGASFDFDSKGKLTVVPALPPDPEEVRAEAAAAMWERIQVERDRRKFAGLKVGDHWFHNDADSRGQWERMANRSAGQPDDAPYILDGSQLAWKTMSKTLVHDFVPLTAGLIRLVIEAIEVQEGRIFKAAEVHKAKMMACDDPASYDFSADWPPVFGEGAQP